ncbi:hypothetical protein BKA59DRAFT_319996 [Fusarium tricinctum]|jgi:hypothetical protein|uniref:Uncharacterized protein n=1 Tax=Fusarium tricinctum TaxID=61284 RepID=A0A8K0RLR2_9HYPO|nr:hypothetical protein BKA59DRAFT_319996 [Fusarium tricinctum]
MRTGLVCSASVAFAPLVFNPFVLLAAAAPSASSSRPLVTTEDHNLVPTAPALRRAWRVLVAAGKDDKYVESPYCPPPPGSKRGAKKAILKPDFLRLVRQFNSAMDQA